MTVELIFEINFLFIWMLFCSTSWEAKNEHVRMKVKDAIVWDMRRPEMLKGTALEGVRFDFVTSCLSMAPATSSIDGYMGIIRNIRYTNTTFPDVSDKFYIHTCAHGSERAQLAQLVDCRTHDCKVAFSNLTRGALYSLLGTGSILTS